MKYSICFHNVRIYRIQRRTMCRQFKYLTGKPNGAHANVMYVMLYVRRRFRRNYYRNVLARNNLPVAVHFVWYSVLCLYDFFGYRIRIHYSR